MQACSEVNIQQTRAKQALSEHELRRAYELFRHLHNNYLALKLQEESRATQWVLQRCFRSWKAYILQIAQKLEKVVGPLTE